MSHRAIRVVTAVVVVAFVALSPAKVPAASSCEWNNVERVVAIGDVHGAYDRFVEILKVAGIVDSELRWIGGRTHVVQLGDIVDRGDDSRKALDLERLASAEKDPEVKASLLKQAQAYRKLAADRALREKLTPLPPR